MSARALVQEIVSERPRKIYGFCTYCGRPCEGLACSAHRKLVALDPHYALKGRAA